MIIHYPSSQQIESFIKENVIPEVENFKPATLYIKRHRKTNLLYFGFTRRRLETYLGSGRYWKSHINTHGKKFVETLWNKQFNTFIELYSFSMVFSNINNIVESSDWANLIPETGQSGGTPVNLGKRLARNKITEVLEYVDESSLEDTHIQFNTTEGLTAYTNSEGQVKFFHEGSQPEGWEKGSSIKGTHQFKSPDGIIMRFKPGTQPEGWVKYSPSTGKSWYISGSGEVRKFYIQDAPTGWKPHKLNSNTSTFINPSTGEIKRFKNGSHPKEWLPFSPAKGKRNYRNPLTKITKRFEPNTQPEGFYEWTYNGGYRDKTIIE